MSRNRLEAFSDGVIAVVITIMVLGLRPPAGDDLADLRPLAPKVSIYLLSFAFLAIYWNNHHHLMAAAERIDGGVMWANAHLLFWLSLTPVATAWLGPHLGKTAPAAAYGVILLGAAIAYGLLARALLHVNGSDSALARALGRDWKGKLSIIGSALAIAVSPLLPWLSIAIYVAVAAVWLVPERRIARIMVED